MATSPSPSTPAASFPFPAGPTEAPDPAIPKLFRPFQWIENPNAEQIAAASDRFIEKFQLLPDAMSLQKFLAMDFHRLGSLVYPFADTTAATIGTDWLVWIFAWDDDCDRTPMGRDPEEMRRRFRQYLDIFYGRPAPANAPPLIVALENLVARMLARAGKEWLDGFIPLVADYFDGCLWEAETATAIRRRASPIIRNGVSKPVPFIRCSSFSLSPAKPCPPKSAVPRPSPSFRGSPTT